MEMLQYQQSSLRGRLEAHEQPKNIKSPFYFIITHLKYAKSPVTLQRHKVSVFNNLGCHALSRARNDGSL